MMNQSIPNKCPEPGPARYNGFVVKSPGQFPRFVQSELNHSESRFRGAAKLVMPVPGIS